MSCDPQFEVIFLHKDIFLSLTIELISYFLSKKI